MPRRPRIHLDNVPLHIVQRGHNREPCFFGEEDYQAYLHWLGEALVKEKQARKKSKPESKPAKASLRKQARCGAKASPVSETVLNSKPAHREICIKRFA